MGSFSTSLSGLDAEEQALSVISNDLSNLNTTAFKTGTPVFSDLFYQMGTIVDASGTTAYNADAVMGGEGPGTFVSAIWDYAFIQDTALVISFGTDCSQAYGYGYVTQCNTPGSLHTNKGWDNVTGVGVPNAKAFADSFAPPAAPAVKK